MCNEQVEGKLVTSHDNALLLKFDVDQVKALVEQRNQIKTLEKTDYSETKFSEWQLPGGENYQETLITMPTRPSNRWQVVEAGQGYTLTQDGNLTNTTEWKSKAEAQQVADRHNEA